MASDSKPVGVASGSGLTQAERNLALQHADDIRWFRDNAYGVDKVRLPERLVPKLIAIAQEKNLSFKNEILKAAAWAITHKEKHNYGRFYAGWLGRAKPGTVKSTVNWEDPI